MFDKVLCRTLSFEQTLGLIEHYRLGFFLLNALDKYPVCTMTCLHQVLDSYFYFICKLHFFTITSRCKKSRFFQIIVAGKQVAKVKR